MVAQPCDLCGQPARFPVDSPGSGRYCCPACREVASLLDEERLQTRKEAKIPANHSTAETVSLPLAGLYCPSCGWLIERRLRGTKGVHTAAVNYIRREARLTFDPGKTAPNKLARRIRALGYRAGLPGETPTDEEDAFFTRLLIGGMLAMHIMMTSLIIYARDWLGWNSSDTLWLEEIFYLMQFVVVIPLVVVLGLPVLRAGIASMLRGLPNTHTLVTIGVVSAVWLSSSNLFKHGGPVYFDTAAMLLLLMTLGRWLEMRAHKSSREAVETLAAKIPPEAIRMGPLGDETIPWEAIRPGMWLRLLPGDRIPVDGVIATGQSDIDESALTGEPQPVLRQPGDPVWAATLNLDGVLEIIVRRTGDATRVGQISRLLHQALWQRSPVERMADQLAARLVPLAVLTAAGTFGFWYWRAGVETALLNALSVLLIACPCALGLATPLTLWQALNRAAQNGVVLQGTAVLEKLARIRHVFFDKTGTLTRLPMQVVFVTAVGIREQELFAIAASVESSSRHPIAAAIRSAAEEQGLCWPESRNAQASPGMGVSGKVQGQTVKLGTQAFIQEDGVQIPASIARAFERCRTEGLVPVLCSREGVLCGLFALGETLRPETNLAVHRLKGLVDSITLISGDPLAAEKSWVQPLGLGVRAGMAPEEKLATIRSKDGTLMVGDGINDGPALAAATVGIALAGGSDVAQNAAEVVLVREDLLAVPWLVELAATTQRKVRQNLGWAIGYNLIGMVLAAGGLLQPVLAALAMLLSSVLVTQNALRLRRFPAIKPLEAVQAAIPETAGLQSAHQQATSSPLP